MTSTSGLPLRASTCTWRWPGPDRQHDRLERRVQVGADPGGDRRALARVRVERLQTGARADLDLADVLVDGLDVAAAGRPGSVMISRQAM